MTLTDLTDLPSRYSHLYVIYSACVYELKILHVAAVRYVREVGLRGLLLMNRAQEK